MLSIWFRKTHDLGGLLDLLTSVERPLASSLGEATALNPYGVDTRYPGDVPEIRPDEAKRAVKLAREVRDAVLSVLPKVL